MHFIGVQFSLVWSHFYRRPTKLREGIVFRGVCLSTGGGGVSAILPPHVGRPFPTSGRNMGQDRKYHHTPPGKNIGLDRKWHYTPPPGTTKADGTHPTGMLSCLLVNLQYQDFWAWKVGEGGSLPPFRDRAPGHFISFTLSSIVNDNRFSSWCKFIKGRTPGKYIGLLLGHTLLNFPLLWFKSKVEL